MLATFLFIVSKIILPIFILVAIGYAAQKFLKMDSRTFSRINIYILVPAVLFLKIYEARVTLSFFLMILAYILIMSTIMVLMGQAVSRIFNYPRGIKMAFCNSLLFFNSGNYGLPLVDLAFKGDPIASTGQAFIMLIQNIITNTYGVFQASSGGSSYKKALKDILAMPTLYVLFIAVLVKVTHVTLPEQIIIPIRYISQGFIGLALITLGVQLAEINVKFNFRDVFISCFIRLILSPIIGYVLVLLLGVKGILAQSLVVGVALPSAVNTAILAREFNNEPEYASQIVLVSTVLSAVTVSIVIYLIRGM